MILEAHITVHTKDAAVATLVAEALHWKTSQIARDPVLGDKDYFYLTMHGYNLTELEGKVGEAITRLRNNRVWVIRSKIEAVLIDNVLGPEPERW